MTEDIISCWFGGRKANSRTAPPALFRFFSDVSMILDLLLRLRLDLGISWRNHPGSWPCQNLGWNLPRSCEILIWSWPDLGQDLGKFYPRSWKILTRSGQELVNITPRSSQDLCQILSRSSKNLGRTCQDLGKILAKISPRSWQVLCKILEDLDKIWPRTCQDHTKIFPKSWQVLGQILSRSYKIFQDLV